MTSAQGMKKVSGWCKIKSFFAEKDQPDLSPKAILKKLNENEVIKKMGKGELSIMSKYQEGLSEKGAEAISIIQDGLIALELIKVDTSCECWWTDFNFGVYGDKTIGAVKQLQIAAGIYPKKIPQGQIIGKQTIAALKKALEAQAKGKNWREAVRPK